MTNIKQYIKFHLRILLDLYKELIIKFDKQYFAILFNFKSLILQSPSRILWNGSSFIVKDKELPTFSYKIRHQRQCNMAYEFGIKKRVNNLEYEYFLDQIEFNDGDTFLDCGANVGDLKLWFELQGININYIAFEPSPTEYSCLKENIYPSIAHNIGLWNQEGELTFYISSQGADSSLIEPLEFDYEISVQVSRLCEFITKPIKCLKLEAEGAEPEILEGIGNKLNMIEFISADLGYERGKDCLSTLTPVTNFLLSNNFELIDVNHGRICALYRNKSPKLFLS